MTVDQIKSVVQIYKNLLWERENLEHDHSTHVTSHLDALNHCISMFDRLDSFVDFGELDKAYRWLGFMQGVLWVCGKYTLAELREHNRSVEN